MKTRLAVFVATASLLCGCGELPRTAPEHAAARDHGKDPKAQEAAAMAAAMRQAARSKLDYKISAADLVSVSVFEVPEMNRRVRVSAGGEVFLPLVGAVEVGGKTLGAAQSLIEKRLAAFVVKPQVTLFIEEYGNRRFSVMGEVQRPGTYPIPTESRMTVLEAISTAGGFTPVAAQDQARLLRFVNGESMNYTIDVRTITREGQKEKDMILEPNDVVFVPQSLF
ncbi:MAG: polysaccharide export protein [Elusimicrobia bacterium]|nr:polysaccharide export protein [Elusimicrobiota bacterium]